MKCLNLNQYIQVQLNPKGVKIYYDYYHGLMPRINHNGYTEIQLWEFMNIYGSYMRMGGENVFEPLEIYICDDDLKDAENFKGE